ncbi:monocopper oxidase-like protein SKU5 [Asparagus officinalis]|uniref:monocopper oxidase-like protein SKU5 n=1 Tax=Asparagus officinalis TaxID=4686 RepID=UPI00098E22FC|nr:monocopper oxidase-like protein SKU5 [Asparagus officinalis]
MLENKPLVTINGKQRATLNGISYSPPSTPLRLADQYNLKGVYTLDFPTKPLDEPPKLGTSLMNASYKGFMEIIFQNNGTNVQTYHLDGHAFFVVGMNYGEWTEESRGTYNKWDAVIVIFIKGNREHTIQNLMERKIEVILNLVINFTSA